MKSLLFALALLVTTPTPAAEDNFLQLVVDFDKHWTRFINDLAGCTNTGQACNPRNGHLNYAEFMKAEKAARHLFHHEPAK